jgi:hypothetical protein
MIIVCFLSYNAIHQLLYLFINTLFHLEQEEDMKPRNLVLGTVSILAVLATAMMAVTPTLNGL